MLDLLFNWRT